MHHSPQISTYSPTHELSGIHLFGFCGGFITLVWWLNHCPLVIRLTSISSPFPESQRSGSELSNPLITKLVLQTTTAVLKAKVKSLSCVRLFVTPWTVAYQTPLSTEFSRQEYWSGLPFPSSGDLPNPGIKPRSPALQVDALLSEPPGNPLR